LEGDGDFPINMAGAAKIGTVVLLGTPNSGSVSALQSMIPGHKVGLSRVAPEVLGDRAECLRALAASPHRPVGRSER
jgi:hypothetical protein